MRAWILCIAMGLASCLMGANQLDLSTIMTPEERKNTGVDKLTPQQRQALEQWLGQWTLKLLNQPAKVPSPTPQVPAGPMKIKSVGGNGAEIQLEDGSYWQVFPTDIAIASGWLPRDKIAVSPSKNDAYPFQLNNSTTGKTICARPLAGYRESPPQQQNSQAPKPDSDPWVPQQGLLLDVNQDSGRVLILNDGTVWNVSPNSAFSTRLWLKGQRLRVEKNGKDQRYPYKIINPTTGEEIPVKQVSNHGAP